MPYSSKIAEATEPSTPFPHPLIPEAAKPEACRRLRCTMSMLREGVSLDANGEVVFDIRRQDLVAFGHTRDGRTDTYSIPLADLDDHTIDIWGTRIKPWMTSLHEATPDST